MQFNANYFIDRLLDYYKVATIVALSSKMQISQQTITSWRTRNSVSAIRKKCRELGIYHDIFNNLISSNNNFQNANLSGGATGVEIGSINKSIHSIANNDFGCDDLVKSLVKELCKKYKDDMDTLKTLLFQLTLQK
ncbi:MULTISPECIES: helix-turn-helix domain-containing protein [Sulfurospirillum]|nr:MULTISPECIES: helix-turn-helix domain-containing protein [Sulfurospirillum]ASC93629.1 hypothetical protein Sdiek2_1611 [Sulfurospirillum diekertiae]ATB69673.1 phage CI repressor superfamily protein [Sulfurospirillum diekertiae]QEH06344.1 phage CI repressor superfamily protein [Sulfurospirillum multivorans]QIR74744.1 hypothetical protein FA584_00320 [Sulfurospirillum diekertiae]